MKHKASDRRIFALHALFGAVIAVCAAGSGQAQTTTLGTRGVLARANPAITTNAGAAWGTTAYDRAADHPNSVTLPLQFITLSSGKRLAVLVTVPADARNQPVAGKFPAVLTQTGYRIDLATFMGTVVTKGNSLIIGGPDDYIVRRGYVQVAVDILGSGMSEGEEALLGAEEQAAYGEAVNWVKQQSWFNGKLGLAGTSYLGITSILTAGQQDPAVKAAFTVVPMGDAYRGTVGIGGMLNAEFISLWLPLTQGLSVANSQAISKYPQYAEQIKAANAEHIAAINDWYLPTVTNSIAGKTGYASDDGDFWSLRSPIEAATKVQVPTFIIGAQNDIFQRDEPLLYEQIKRNANAKLVVLPGAHLQSVLKALGGAAGATSKGAPAAPNLMLQWFDQYLQGRDTGAATLPNVTQLVPGWGSADRYATSTDWPHPQMSPQRLYLRGDLSLSTSAPTSAEATHTVSEPAAPVVTYTASSSGDTVKSSVKINDGSDCSSSDVQWSLGMNGILPKACQSNSATVEKAQKAVIFETPALAADLYLNGPMQADIWITTTKTQAAVAVRIDDVDALGKATPISTGLLSAAYRGVDLSRSRFVNGVMIQPWHAFTEASRQAVVPGQPMLVPVEIFPAATLLKKGHKLRVAISASNQAMGIWPTPQQLQANGNVSTILNDAAHPSSVVLPVVPTSVLN
jgi:putative CocE/NonD family hydrolase